MDIAQVLKTKHAQLASHQKAIEQLQQDIAALERAEAILRQGTAASPAPSSSQKKAPVPPAPAASEQLGMIPPTSLAGRCFSILQKAGRELQLDHLISQIVVQRKRAGEKGAVNKKSVGHAITKYSEKGRLFYRNRDVPNTFGLLEWQAKEQK